MKNKYIYLMFTFVMLISTTMIGQRRLQRPMPPTGGEFALDKGDLIATDPCDACPETLANITFGYNIQAALTASSLIKKAQDDGLEAWFTQQHTVLKEEIEKQLGQQFANYDDARNTFFKHFERNGIYNNHQPIENKYRANYLAKRDKESVSLRNLKLLRLRENELKAGNIGSSLYANFTYNGTPLDQINSLNQLKNLWTSELSTFSENHWRYRVDLSLTSIVGALGNIQNYSHEIFTDLFNKQLAYYNQHGRWEQLDLMQSYLNQIVPPMALPNNDYTSQLFGTSQYIDNYAVNKLNSGNIISNIFHPYYYQHTTVYKIWLAREGRQEAIERATDYVEGLRNTELNSLLEDVEVEDGIINQLTGKDKCVYNKLKSLNLFKSTIKKFEDSDSYNLIIKYDDCSNTNEACTDAEDIENGNISINIEARTGSKPLEFAAILLHEGIHAELFKYVDEHNQGLDPNERDNLLYHYFEAKRLLEPQFVNSWAQHQHMADKYVKPIAEAIRILDNNKYPLEYYMGYGWDGLRKYGYDGYYDNGNWVSLNKAQSTEYYKKQKIVNDNTDLRNNECN